MDSSGVPPTLHLLAGRCRLETVAMRPVRPEATSAPAAWPSAAQYVASKLEGSEQRPS